MSHQDANYAPDNADCQDLPNTTSETYGIITPIPDTLKKEAYRIRSRLIWFWQGIFHLSEAEKEQLTEICRWCLGEMEMKFTGPDEPIVTFCPRPCNLSPCHLSCWTYLMHLHREESARDSSHPGFQCFSCRDPVQPLVSHLYSDSEKGSGLPILDQLPLCPWCRKLEQPIKHLLDCQELPNHFASLSDGEVGDLLNLVPRLLNTTHPAGWADLGIYDSERRSCVFRWKVRVAGTTRQIHLRLQPNVGSYDTSHMQRILKHLFHVWAVVEEYLEPGMHPARRGEFRQLHRNLCIIRQLGLSFPHQWCRGHGICVSLLSKEAFDVFKAASEIVGLLMGDDWGIPKCLNDRQNRSKTPHCLHCSERPTEYGKLIEHSLGACRSGQNLLALSVLARRVRNSLRRPFGSEENGRQLISNISGLSEKLHPMIKALQRAVCQHATTTVTTKRFRSLKHSTS